MILDNKFTRDQSAWWSAYRYDFKVHTKVNRKSSCLKRHHLDLNLINFFHSAGILSVSLKGWHVHVISNSLFSLILVNAKTKLDHAVNPRCVPHGILEAETRGQQAGLKQQHNKILDRLVILISFSTLAKVLNNGMIRVAH